VAKHLQDETTTWDRRERDKSVEGATPSLQRGGKEKTLRQGSTARKLLLFSLPQSAFCSGNIPIHIQFGDLFLMLFFQFISTPSVMSNTNNSIMLEACVSGTIKAVKESGICPSLIILRSKGTHQQPWIQADSILVTVTASNRDNKPALLPPGDPQTRGRHSLKGQRVLPLHCTLTQKYTCSNHHELDQGWVKGGRI
jgi:hypothetical protein